MKRTNVIIATLLIIASSFTFRALTTYTVVADQSELHWYAKKVTGKHDGTIGIKSGSLDLEKGKLVGGEFVIDMATIAVTDLSGGSKAKLEGHLNSADFFDVENHKTAAFKMTKVKKTGKQATTDKAQEYEVTGDLTIKGKTESITFKTYVKTEGDKVMARANEIIFNRAKFDIKYGSETFFGSLGDKAIYDDVKMTIELIAKK